MRLMDLALLRSLVDQSGFSQRQLASKAGLSHGTVGNLLAGRRTGCSLAVFTSLLYALGPALHAAFEPRRRRAP